jgi:hypothetical protein
MTTDKDNNMCSSSNRAKQWDTGRDTVIVPHGLNERRRSETFAIKRRSEEEKRHTFLGLLAKIKCSICSYQFNI